MDLKTATGVIGDVRSVIQDLLSPELKATIVRLETLDKEVSALHTQVDQQFKEARDRMDDRLTA